MAEQEQAQDEHKQEKQDKQGKNKQSQGKSKSAKQGKGTTAQPGNGVMSIAAHPRAARRVAQAKGWGGLVGFLLGCYLSLPTNTFADAALHGLIAGIACYVVVWAGAVFLWRQLVVAELKGRQHELLQAELERIGAS